MDVPKINELIKSQESDAAELQRILTNIKKDSSTRKTQKYIDERRKQIQDIYNKSLQNHALLEEQDILSTHRYKTQNYFYNFLTKTYDAAMERLTNFEQKLKAMEKLYEPNSSSSTERQAEEKISSPRLGIQLFKLRQLQRQIENAESCTNKNKPVCQLQLILQNLQTKWQDFEDTHLKLLMEESTIDHEYFEQNLFEEIQNQVETITEILYQKISEASTQKLEHRPFSKLPPINIPIFTGTYESWNSFYDLFIKIIHEDRSLTSTEKMQYLKSHVRGEAAKLIKHLTVNEVNYDAALTLLTKRYKDERLIVNTFIDKLLDLPKIKSPNFQLLRDMHDTINECLEALKNQKIQVQAWGPFLTRIMTRKWDQETNSKYEEQLENPNQVEDFGKLMQFLEKRFKNLESCSASVTINKHNNYNQTPQYKQHNMTHNNQEKSGMCWFCKNDHNINQCIKFKSLNVNDRIRLVKEKHMCYKCLNHDEAKQCVSIKYRECEVCRKAHNTLLHKFNEFNKKQFESHNKITSQNNAEVTQNIFKWPAKPKQQQKMSNVSSSQQQSISNETKNVLLATALVQSYTIEGTPQLLRVLLDQGSEASFCTEEVAQLLNYPKNRINIEISGIADNEPKTSNYTINLTLKPRFPSNYKLNTTLIVLPKLTGSLPRHELYTNKCKTLDDKIIADPTYYKTGPIDIILGAEEYSKILLNGLEKTEDGIMAQNTEFGWILSGYYSTEQNHGMKILSMVTNTDEIKQLTRFWELEELSENKILNEDDQKCENYYKQTTTRDSDGTYTVRLPFKDFSLEYGDTRQVAAARLFQLERKLEKNQDLRQQYNDFMKEYLAMGHMRKVQRQDYGEGKFYIPHQPVIKQDSLTTKLRVVFDASNKTHKNKSLNENMFKGPRLQQDLATILLRWRKHKIAFMADIEKMYRFIKVNDLDLTYQRILWRFSPKDKIDEYELTTVTYGTTAAPYLAIKTLQQLAMDEKNNYPEASKATLKDFYVDDILSGAANIDSAKQLQTQIISLLRAGGFKLRKWSANCSELLGNVPKDNTNDDMLKLPLDEARKSLGVAWAPLEDKFYFKITIKMNENPTKRFILSEIAKIFDPLGWLAPIIITLKLLIQELWTNGMEWDKPVNEITKNKWLELQKQLKCVENIKIPRWCHITQGKIELHGFCDASEKAYGAAVYCRVKIDGIYHTSLLQAKSKVAPKKHKTTLPRLELCAAVLLTNLMKKVIEAMNFENTELYCWTDSMITLGWIRGEAGKWHTFVANRVSEIQQIPYKIQWNHVQSADNPADLISRGIEASKLENHLLWWPGPNWLRNEKLPRTKTLPEPKEEIKHCHNISVKSKNNNNNDLLTRFSSFQRMLRVLSYCMRFIRRKWTTEPLTCKEIDDVRKIIIQQVQKEAFKEEFNLLKNKQPLKKGNKLSSLDPFIDKDGLIRVGGRLQHSELPYNQKHPLLLPYDHHITSIITNDAHIKTLHGGNKLTLAYLGQQYWILGKKRKVKYCINKCVKCIRYKALTAEQKMGALPKPRVTPSPPFSYTGVDYAGPIQVRTMKGRGHKAYKGYIAVFICLATKAIHLELVGDLSTESFIAALRRFMARRGHVTHMYSDNATNFVGAANFLKSEILEITQSPHFQNELSNIGTQWHFIPPAAPHFGGIWEAGVKSMKHHLRRVIGDSTLTYEELSTFLCQIEACLNSRPLCVQSDNIDDNLVLTPSHFLIGRQAVGVPDPVQNVNTDILNRWKHIQKMKKCFWTSWSNDYLNQLQQRYKWKINSENLKVGTIVLIKDENLSPSRWPIARIKEVHTGADDVTRVVTLEKSSGSEQKRSIHSLIPLPVNTDLEIQQTNKTPVQTNVAIVHDSTKIKRHKTISRMSHWMFIFMIILQSICLSTATYTMKQLQPGMYVEQMGTAKVSRGKFRIETNFLKETFDNYVQSTYNVSLHFKELCDNTIPIDSETHCSQFYHHLKEEVEKFHRDYEYLTNINSNSRKKRGILGQLMTSIFGVNDEVYRDIDILHQNQQKLIESANHQTKFMLSTISAVNQTEQRIENKLESFRLKLNQALEYINNNNVWYRTIDKNQIKIQILQSFQLASNYITEILGYYAGLMNIYLSHASVYSILSPHHVREIIKSANDKLPPNLKIVQSFLLDTRISENETHIQVLSYFPIEDTTNYTLMYVTSIPNKNNDGSFQSILIDKPVLGVDYNNERFFELSNDEFRQCFHKYNHFICFPVAVKNMQSNCIVEQLFKNTSSHCRVKSFNLTTEIIWKQLEMKNTWLFVAKNSVTASIICDGQREEITIYGIGVIQISENCITKTFSNTLTAQRINTVTVLASYSKPNNFSFNSSVVVNNYKDISKEQILDSSKDLFNHLRDDQQTLQTQLENTVFQSIERRSYVASSVVMTIFFISFLLVFCFRRQMTRWMQCSFRRRHHDGQPARAARGEQPDRPPTIQQPRPATSMTQSVELYQLKEDPFVPDAESRQDVHT